MNCPIWLRTCRACRQAAVQVAIREVQVAGWAGALWVLMQHIFQEESGDEVEGMTRREALFIGTAGHSSDAVRRGDSVNFGRSLPALLYHVGSKA